MKKSLTLIFFMFLVILAGCNEVEEKDSDPKVLLNEIENHLPASTLPTADLKLQEKILSESPEIKSFSILTATINKKDPDSYFAIKKLRWSKEKTTITSQFGGGRIRYDTYYKCTSHGGFLWSCDGGYTVDNRMRLKSNNNEYYIYEISEFPRRYAKKYTEKNKEGKKVTKTKYVTRGYIDLPKKSYRSTNYSMVFNNIPYSALRRFDIYEDYCGDSGDYDYDICGIRIKYFDQELKEQKKILKFLSSKNIGSISIDGIENLYKKYSKYDDIKIFLATKILFRVKQKNSIEDLHKFNKKYSLHNEAVIESIDKLYDLIKIKDSVAGYEWFISNYSDSKYSKFALERIHEIMFSKAQKVDTIAAYNSFVFSYPTAKQVEQANEIANRKEKAIYTNFGVMSFWDADHKKEKKSRKFLIKAKQIERFPRDNKLYGKRKSGYLIVANRMYHLLQEEFDDTDATLRHLESQEFKDFVKDFKSIMSEIKSTLDNIDKNSRNISRYTEEMVKVSKNGFSDAKADRAMTAYYAQEHRNWEKFMHFRDKGFN